MGIIVGTSSGAMAGDYATLSGAAFSGPVTAPEFSSSGKSSFRALYVGRDVDIRAGQFMSLDSGTTSFVLGGWAGGWSCNIHDGTGRVNFRWNMTPGSRPKFLRGGEHAAEWDLDGWGGYGLSVRCSVSTGRAGGAVTLRTLMSVGPSGMKIDGAVRTAVADRAGLPAPAAAMKGAIMFVDDAGAGHAAPVYCDGASWRRVSDDAVV